MRADQVTGHSPSLFLTGLVVVLCNFRCGGNFDRNWKVGDWVSNSRAAGNFQNNNVYRGSGSIIFACQARLFFYFFLLSESLR